MSDGTAVPQADQIRLITQLGRLFIDASENEAGFVSKKQQSNRYYAEDPG
ncbi:hypothetical protein [Mycobacterium sp. E2497]|nr:hypothetical protein [Mycobacterium sp. E2497]